VVLGISAAADGITESLSVGAAACRLSTGSAAAGCICAYLTARQRFIAGAGSKLNDRLERISVGNVLNNVLSDVSQRVLSGHVDDRSLSADFDDRVAGADF